MLATSLALAALAGCGGSDGGADATTSTTTPAETTTTLSADEAFDLALTTQLDGLDATFIGGSRAAARTLCGNLTTLAAEPDEDDPVSALTPEVLIGTLVDGYTQPEIAAVVLRAAATSYCPEQAAAIEAVLTARDL